MDTNKPLVAPEDDIGLLCMIISNGFADTVLDQLAAKGFDDARFGHGYIVQGLLAGDRTVTELAQRLGVSVQAASKTVKEMEVIGYIERSPDPRDARSSLLALSERGTASVATSRLARFELMRRLEKRLGKKQTRETIKALRTLAAEFGGLEAMAARRLRPPADRT